MYLPLHSIETVSVRAKKASITNGDIYETERKRSQLRNKTKQPELILATVQCISNMVDAKKSHVKP